jgi:hypothetical protein
LKAASLSFWEGASLRFTTVGSGLCAAALLTLGLSGVAPIGDPLNTVCNLGGVASAMLFLGLLEDA